MGLRDDDPSMYEKAHEHCQCDNCNRIRTNERYAANDTRMGSGGNHYQGNPHGSGPSGLY